MSDSKSPSIDQPLPTATVHQPEQLVTPQSMGNERLVALDAFIAERFGNWERRKLPANISGKGSSGHLVWMWRPPRDAGQRGSAPWQPRPPTFCGLNGADPEVIRMTDTIGMKAGVDFFLTTVTVPVQGAAEDEDQVLRCYIAGFGRTQPSGAFHGQVRAFAWPVELACCLLLAKHAGADMKKLHAELFAPSDVSNAPSSETTQ